MIPRFHASGYGTSVDFAAFGLISRLLCRLEVAVVDLACLLYIGPAGSEQLSPILLSDLF